MLLGTAVTTISASTWMARVGRRIGCPYLFAAQPVFVAAPQLARMAQVVQAVESIVALAAYKEQVLAAAPPIARIGTHGPRGAFFGYDFHLTRAVSG